MWELESCLHNHNIVFLSKVLGVVEAMLRRRANGVTWHLMTACYQIMRRYMGEALSVAVVSVAVVSVFIETSSKDPEHDREFGARFGVCRCSDV